MKLKKVLSAVVFSIFMLLTLSGCAPKEGATLLNAISKQSEITSYEQKIEMTANINSPNSDGEEAFLLNIINGAVFRIDAKQDIANSKQFANVNVDLGGVVANVPVYSDSNKMLVKPLFEKNYIEISSDELAKISSGLNDTSVPVISLDRQRELQLKLQKIISKFITEYAIEHPSALKNISSKGTQTITTPEGSKEVSVIEVKFNDADFKKFIMDTLGDISDSKSFKEFAKSMIEVLPEIIKSSELSDNYEVQSILKELSSNFDGNYDMAVAALKQNLPQIKSIINQYFGIGSNGLVLTYYIDNNGYITKTNAVIDCILKQPSYDEKTTEQVGFTLKVDSLIYNINKTVVESPVPAGTKAIPIKQYIKNSPIWKDSPIADALGISPIHAYIYMDGYGTYGYTNNGYYDFTTKPYMSNGNLMVPVGFVEKALRLEVTPNAKRGTVTLTDGTKTVVISHHSKQAIVNNKPRMMPVEPQITENDYMVPLRFIASQFGAKVGWNSYEYQDYYDGTTKTNAEITITKEY